MGRGAFFVQGCLFGLAEHPLRRLLPRRAHCRVNVMTLLEGDEILGSPYYRDMFAK